MTTKQKNTSTARIFKRVIVVVMFFSLSYAQELDVISFQTGTLQTFIDVRRGNFSMFDKGQEDVDFMSFLFGGAVNPNSYFTVTVDGNTQTLEQMQVKQPFGITLGSQVDGMFYAGESRDILVEVAYFSLDIINTGDFNSVGIILKLSNISFNNRDVSVNFTLDTDVGESHNNPQIQLSTGEVIDSSYVFNNTPKFLFFGEGNIFANNFDNKGFYLYPYVSEILPSYMVVANWRKIFEQKEIEAGESFSYKEGSVRDIGMELRYENITLEKNDTAYVGLVISKQQSIVSPVLSRESITKGVFNEDRFKIEALLNKNLDLHVQGDNVDITNRINQVKQIRQSLPDYIPSDTIWGYLYKINSDMKQSSSDIDSKLKPYTPLQTNGTFFQK